MAKTSTRSRDKDRWGGACRKLRFCSKSACRLEGVEVALLIAVRCARLMAAIVAQAHGFLCFYMVDADRAGTTTDALKRWVSLAHRSVIRLVAKCLEGKHATR